MPSLVAWLDASSEDQRRMREIVNLFSERDSRDELGIGQIRDAISDTLFPGTSTLLTRARYMLLIPWAFVAATKHGLNVDEIARRVEKNERNLIGSLKRDTSGEGLLGRSAGVALKTLPSSIYWVALRQYGILLDPTLSQTDAIAAGIRHSPDDEDEPHLTGAWSATLPTIPDNFPDNTAGGFDLSRPEAEWLRDRILGGTDGSLLAHFVDNRPQPESEAPWRDPASVDAPRHTIDALQHARLFSLAMNGASLLYNLLLAEAYESAGYDRVTGTVDSYRQRLAHWREEREGAGADLAAWRRDEFWDLVHAKNPRIQSSRAFVDGWLDAMTADGQPNIVDNNSLRAYIDRRERRHKGAQARLQNPRLLQSWLGASGAGALNYRWRQVRGILIDLHDGLERADA